MGAEAEIKSLQNAGVDVAVGATVLLLGAMGTLAIQIIRNKNRVPRLRSKLYRNLAKIFVATRVCLETAASGNEAAAKTLLDNYVTPSTLRAYKKTLHSLDGLQEAGAAPRAEFEAFQALVDRLIAIKERREVGLVEVWSIWQIFDESLQANFIDGVKLKHYSEQEVSFTLFVALKRFLVRLGFLEKQVDDFQKFRDDFEASTRKVNKAFDAMIKADRAAANLARPSESQDLPPRSR